MRTLLRGSLGKSLEAMTEEDRLAAAWTVVCGRVLSGRGVITGYTEGVVQVEVVDAVWMQQMSGMRKQLVRELRAIANVPVRDLRFIIRRRAVAGAVEVCATNRMMLRKEISGE